MGYAAQLTHTGRKQIQATITAVLHKQGILERRRSPFILEKADRCLGGMWNAYMVPFEVPPVLVSQKLSEFHAPRQKRVEPLAHRSA